MKTLILITARAGSKGLPGKNTKLLGDIPLIQYSITFAKKIKKAEDVICLSTNDNEVIRIAESEQIDIPFIRPEELASDEAGSYEVILHALEHYHNGGKTFDAVLLLQPTSPFRNIEDYQKLKKCYERKCDMAVTIRRSKENPYFNVFEENESGELKKSKESDYQRRQDCPNVFAYNGSMYLIRVESLMTSNLTGFKKIYGSLMPDERSVDIDTMLDWVTAEYLLKQYQNESS